MLSRYRYYIFSKLVKTPFAKEAEKIIENIECPSILF